jgi:putative ABC transport system permease protein
MRMFNLESAIQEWKKSLRINTAVEDGDAVELEGYLRDKIEDLRGRGMSEEDAFKAAESEFLRAEGLDGDYDRARLIKSGNRPSWQHPRWMPALFWNYWKTAGRKIRLQKGYAAIAIGSLSLAMTVGLLTLLWARYEMRYDRFHKNAASIYRVLYQSSIQGPEAGIHVPHALPAVVKQVFPEVAAASSVQKLYPGTRFESPKLIDYKSSIALAEPDFLALFDFPLLKGDPWDALSRPKSVVLTETAARKFFGRDDDPIGRILLIGADKIPLTVTGVLKDIPETSHLDFDLMMPDVDYSIFDRVPKPDDWFHVRACLYVQLRPGADAAALEGKMTRLVNDRLPSARGKLTLQPLRDIHLRSDHVDSRGLSDRRRIAVSIHQIRLFLFVALAVLLMGGINYVNLATARSLKRAKEIGIRKVNGAGRGDIIRQFLGESLLFTFAALGVAVFIVVLVGLPVLRRLTGMAIDLGVLNKGRLLLEFIGLAVLTGLAAGIYPALFVSTFSPVKVLKGAFAPKRKSIIHFRRILVVVQLACSATLISVIAVLVLQLRYMDRKDLGFKRDSILVINNDIIDEKNVSAVKNELLSHPAVRAAATGHLPLLRASGHFIQSKTLWWEGKSPETKVAMDWIFVDEDYQKTYGLEVLQGRFFSREVLADRKNFVLNESAVKAMGLKDPIGRAFKVQGQSGQIIGVIKDFHVGTLKAEIRPMYFQYLSGYFGISVRFDPRQTAAALKHMAAVVRKYDPERTFEYGFLDDYLRRIYGGERLSARIVSIFGLISMLISCLGLFGLISFMAEQRTKEIGIRKVLGASVFRIIRMISAEFAVLVGLAVLAAAPIGYVLASRWIGDFAYRIGLSGWIFAGAAGLVFILTLGAVSFRTIRAAKADPVESLRYE